MEHYGESSSMTKQQWKPTSLDALRQLYGPNQEPKKPGWEPKGIQTTKEERVLHARISETSGYEPAKIN